MLTCNSSRPPLKHSKPKSSSNQVRFAQRVELFVGYEHDLTMGKWFMSLDASVRRSPPLVPEIESDLTSFMSHGQHVPPRVVDPDPTPIVENTDIILGPQAQEAHIDSSDEDEHSDAVSDQSDWHPALIYSYNRDPIPVRLDWNDYEGAYRRAAEALEIPIDRLLHLEQVHWRPDDLDRIQVEVLLAYQFGDIPDGADRHATLVDVEFHNHLPSRTPEVVRRICQLPTRLQRRDLLQGLGLSSFVHDAHDVELIWQNHEVCRQDGATWIHIADGDYVRIAIPPHPAECLRRLSTRRIASARFCGMSIEDILSREMLIRLGWHQPAEDEMPNVPTDYDFDLHEEVALLQEHVVTKEKVESADVTTCRLFHDMRPLYAFAAEAQQRERQGVQMHLNQQPAVIQALHLLWQLQGTVQPGHDHPQLRVHTWFLSMPTRPQCRASRIAVLEGDFQFWHRELILTWADLIEHELPVDVHLVAPTPPAEMFQPRDEPHLLLVQRSPAEGRATLVTAVKPSHTGRPIEHMATFMPQLAGKNDITTIAQLEMHCFPQILMTQCMVWHGDRQLQDQQQWQLRNGMSIEIVISPPLPMSDVDPWQDDEDGASLLQIKTCLLLDELIPEVEAVKLTQIDQTIPMPTYIEIPKGAGEEGVHTELRAWGIHGVVHRFGKRAEYLVIPAHHQIPEDKHHYMFCHDDIDDIEGALLHSSDQLLAPPDLMRVLCQLGYDRAVIKHHERLSSGFHRINFMQCTPQILSNDRPVRQRSAWPQRQPTGAPRKPLFALPETIPDKSACTLTTPFGVDDLKVLTAAGDNVLCQDFSSIDLPEFVTQALLPARDPQSYDRWLIYTDGTSQTKFKHHAPEYADAHGGPDAWAMLVLGEVYHPDGSSTVEAIGWMAHPVRTDPNGTSYAGAVRIGADVAEREGLLSAGLWRLTQNTDIPTVFCVDSRVTGGQAMGSLGVTEADLSYRLLRGVFQCLQRGLSDGHLQLHHVFAHAGDPFNEFVDLVAKQEAKKSFNLPRVRLDMQKWIHYIPHLWLCFGKDFGLPQWNGTMNIDPPNLPAVHDEAKNRARHNEQVAMHCHVSLASINVQSLSRHPDGHAGKLRYLYDQVQHYHLNLIGIQEGRNQEGSSKSHGVYRICAGHLSGQYGVELWVNLRQAIGHDVKGQPVYLESHHFNVAHRDPQRLIVRCDSPLFSAWLFVAHSPHSGRARQERFHWWQQTDELIHQFDDGDPWFWFIDANAAPGNADDQTVFAQNLPTSTNTPLFRQCLETHSLCLPSTSHCHHGTRTTWISFNQDMEHTIDYIVVPRDWLSACTYSCVIEDLDLGIAGEDHRAVGLQLQWHCQAPSPQPKTAKRAQKLDWNDLNAKETIRKELQKVHVQPWETDVERQANHLSECLHGAMQQCSKPHSQPKKPYMIEKLWKLRGDKIWVRKRLKQLRHRAALHVLHATFAAWNQRDSAERKDEHFGYMTTLCCVKLRYQILHHRLAHQIKKELQQAKGRAMRERLQSIDDNAPASAVLRSLRDFIGPTNVKLCKKPTIPHVRNHEGEICHLPSEALAVWIEFFRGMEGGRRMSWENLRRDWIANLCAAQANSIETEATEMPTLTDLEIAMRKTSCGKASGNDALPGELLHFFPTEIAALVFPSIWKLMIHGSEDLSYKGGLLVQAYKGRGPTNECASFRSLLISSQIGKAIHRTIRSSQASVFERFLQAQQVGGKRHMPVCFGLHLVRAHLRSAHRRGVSAAVIFIDLKEAFYRIFRPLCLHHRVTDEALAEFLQKLNMPTSALHELWQLLEGPNALEQAAAPQLLQKSIAAIHANTHFWMRQQTDAVQTEFGSRPGDPFADVVFSYVWALVLRRLQEQMSSNGLIEQHPALAELPLFELTEAASRCDALHEYMGPTWMDDTAICLSDTTPNGVIQKTIHTAAILLDLCLEHGLSPNLSRGKTETLLSIRGHGSRQVRKDLFGPQATGTLTVISEHKVHHVPVTNRYLHLGGMLHHGRDQRVEIKRRLALAHSAFNQHRRVLYHNDQIDQTKKNELFNTLIVSKMMYGAESWVATDNATVKAFDAAVLRLYRRLFRVPPAQHLRTEELLAKVELPSPTVLLRRQRLRYLGTLFHCGVRQEWGVLAADVDWCAIIEEDLMWMWAQLARSSVLQCPKQHFAQWRNIIVHHPRFWKRLIRRAVLHDVMQNQRLWRIKDFHFQAIPKLCEIFGQELPSELCDDDQTDGSSFGCLHCQQRFANKAGEAAHMFRRHGHVAKERRYIEEPTCPACLKVFHTMQKTKAHIYYSRRCREKLQSRPLSAHLVPGAGSRDDRLLADRHDHLLPPLQAEGPINRECHRREDPGIDHDFFVHITDAIAPNLDLMQFYDAVLAYVKENPISWTIWTRTLLFFKEAFEFEDAQYAGVSLADMSEQLERLRASSSHAFLHVPRPRKGPIQNVDHLEQQCADIDTRFPVPPRPQAFGCHRVILHAFSGRRRPGDLQFFLEQFTAEMSLPDGCILHIVSLDVVIDPVHGNVKCEKNRRYWLTAIQERKVVAFLAGPPCETWTCAREHQLQDSEFGTGPRVVRDLSELWGFSSMTLRELAQVTVGNELLIFSLEAIIGLVETQGCALLEHPAEPAKESSASIWRLPAMQILLESPNVERCKIAQGLLGAPTPKPTEFLVLNMPGLIHRFHKWRVRRELPKACAIGRSESGGWRTAPLKEYPPALCAAVAESILSAVGSWPCEDVQPPLAEELDLWHRLHATEYGAFLGPDFKG